MKMVVASRQSWNSKAAAGLNFRSAQASAIMMQAGAQVGDEPLLETQRIAAILVVAAMTSKLLVAALAVARDRGVVGHVHFETDGAAAARGRGRFGGRGAASLPPHVHP